MTIKNLDLPKEGDIVMVAGKLEGNMKDRLEGTDPIGTCIIITKNIVSVLFKNSDIWWGKPYEVYIHEVETPEGLEPPSS